MPIISLTQVSLTRQGTAILKDISLEIDKDQHVAIIGPNGAGKSFLLRIISADIIPSSGTVTIMGKQFGKVSLWDLRRQIGYVASRLAYGYPDKSTVLDIVLSGYSGTYANSEEHTEAQIQAAHKQLEFFQMDHLAERDFKVLSDGERRKTLLARAMVIDPKILIFDEPCQGLDIPTREMLLADIDRLAQKTPILYVTHHLEELPTAITDVALIKNGQLDSFAPKQELLTSAKMTALFDYPVQVVQKENRFYVQHG